MKKDKPKKSAPKKQSKSDADYYARQFGGKVEAVSALVENVNDWNDYKETSQEKFDVYPSAYANA